jgi:chromosome partitioning protein
MEPSARRTLVVNGKGGCGKTTIATNLAAAYAQRGERIVLIDHDAQASSTQWHEHRASDLPRIDLIEAHRRTSMYTTRAFQQRLPVEAERIVIDTPSAVGDAELDTLLRGIDVVIVPLLPSSIDIRAGTRFIAQLVSHRMFRAKPVPVGVVANRVRHNTLTHSKLVSFLDCLNVPTVATFRDSSIYTRLAEDGSGIFDVERDASIERELVQWHALLGWIDERIAAADCSGRSIRHGPQSATVHPRLDRSALVQ